jgi:hypothetical protein
MASPLWYRSLFAVMLIICVTFVHANTFVVALCHFAYFATTIQIVGMRELDETEFVMSSILYGIVSIMLFFAYYHICFVRCQEFLLREHAVASRAASVASKLTNNFICQVLHDFGTPLTTISLGMREIEAEGLQNSANASYLKDMKLACWYLKSLRDRAIQYARLTMNSAPPFVRISTINIREFMVDRFFPIAQGKVNLLGLLRSASAWRSTNSQFSYLGGGSVQGAHASRAESEDRRRRPTVDPNRARLVSASR